MHRHTPGLHPQPQDALACPASARTASPHTSFFFFFFFFTQTWPRRTAAAATGDPGAPACARIHRDCTTETLGALECKGIHQNCNPTTQDAPACDGMTPGQHPRNDAKRVFFFF
jgi:hypothetical protein